MPKKKRSFGFSDAIIIFIILFFLAKAFGLTRRFLAVDPFGLEGNELIWGLVSVGFGYFYRETRDLKIELRNEMKELGAKMSTLGERIARIEGKLGIS